jgi:hypothetical protein
LYKLYVDHVQEIITYKYEMMICLCAAGKHKEPESWSRRSSGKNERSSKEELKRRSEKKITPPGTEGKDKERSTPGRRTKSRSRSPVQHHRRTPSSVSAVLPGSIQASQNEYLKTSTEMCNSV